MWNVNRSWTRWTSPNTPICPRAQVWARELDEGRWWCPESTMYRILRAAGQSGDRRARLTRTTVPRTAGAAWLSWGFESFDTVAEVTQYWAPSTSVKTGRRPVRCTLSYEGGTRAP